MPSAPWLQGSRSVVRQLKTGRQRLALSIRQMIADATAARVHARLSPVRDGELQILRDALELLIAPGEDIPERMNNIDREIACSVEWVEREEAAEAERAERQRQHEAELALGGLMDSVRGIEPMETAMDWRR